MRNSWPAVALIAGYTLVEVLLLMLTAVPLGSMQYPGWYRSLVWFGQLILIPGMAALTLRLIIGPAYGWRQALVTLSIGLLVVPAVLLPCILIAFAGESFAAQPGVISALWLILTPLVSVIVLSSFVRWRRRRDMQHESERWLNERRSGIDHNHLKCRNRAVRRALWIPSATVLLLFVFLPEIWGFMWHLSNTRKTVPGYHVPVPATWFGLYGEVGSRYMSGLAGIGLARGFNLYHDFQVPFSRWDVWLGERNSSYWLENEPLPSTRTFTLGKETLTCREYQPTKLFRSQPAAPSGVLYIECSGNGELKASLYGERAHAAAFYKMIGGIQRIE